MNILAVDAASTRSGIALFINGKVHLTAHHNSNKKLLLSERLTEFGRFLNICKSRTKLDYVAILKASMSRNMNTVRMIAYFESVAIAKAGEWNVMPYIINDKSARKRGLGSGKLTKQEAYDKLKVEYKLPIFKDGGADEADAITAGLACLEENG